MKGRELLSVEDEDAWLALFAGAWHLARKVNQISVVFKNIGYLVLGIGKSACIRCIRSNIDHYRQWNVRSLIPLHLIRSKFGDVQGVGNSVSLKFISPMLAVCSFYG